MQKIISIVSVFLLSWSIASAQHKLGTVNDDFYDVTVLSIDKNVVRIWPIQTDYTVIKQFPRGYVKSISFQDGYTAVFDSTGVLVRSGLASVPTMKAKTDGIYAEGLFKLDADETRERLGDDRYYLYYLPVRTMYKMSALQMLAGGAIMLPCVLCDNKNVLYQHTDHNGVEFKGMTIHGVGELLDIDRYRFKGEINPYMVSLEFLGTATAAVAAINMISCWSGLHNALKTNAPLPSLKATRTKYWAGIGMMAAGIGCLAAGTADMASKSKWDWNVYYNNPDNRRNYKNGQYPVAGPILALAGSVLVNVGVSEFVLARKRLDGFGQLNGNRQLAVNAGFVPGGYGLTVTF